MPADQELRQHVHLVSVERGRPPRSVEVAASRDGEADELREIFDRLGRTDPYWRT